MLNFIECNKFAKRKIIFKEKLNIILGNAKSSNSIGKSNLLKIIDFAHGGDTFLNHSKDVIEILGHHTYKFSFIFNGTEHHWSRSTDTPNEVSYLYGGDSPSQTLPLAEYLKWLHRNYTPEIEHLSFRSIVSPFSRVWGKEYIEVSKPLHTYRAQSGEECVNYLIKIFNRYGEISDLSIRLDDKKSEKTALNKAFSKNIITKINKVQYAKNIESINEETSHLNGIRKNLTALALSINEIIDKELLELKTQKNDLLTIRSIIASSLERTRSNLETNKKLSQKSYESLLEILPSANISKIQKIDEFHSGITKILNKQIKEKEQELLLQLQSIDLEIEEYNRKIVATIASSGNPTHIVDSIADITLKISKLEKDNLHFEQSQELNNSIRELKEKLKDKKEDIITNIQDSLNKDIAGLVEFIYRQKRQAPVLTINPQSYSYTIPKDTGTGKAYANLILLDSSILRHTKVPFLIHDTIIFKNIEDSAIVNALHLYNSLKQQTFIALDGSILDKEESQLLITQNSIIKLDENSSLYGKDWRSDL